ncbi:MAG: sugar ABC transporter permease [Chloroflexi bacterium]|uniref:Sugar ABC transporter permease n=2 Tax=Candidatus Thermofonsia Clade 3 TaxID=2364209 RepID=A0A2M8QBG8_9CHLR|nr:MAG: sugar ABC transporter permease [Candidatus Thermofonsia Clade 3 bacterium]RMG65795.1 MAG: sugar ABC transporter permease [Chloroflexota bacterium]
MVAIGRKPPKPKQRSVTMREHAFAYALLAPALLLFLAFTVFPIGFGFYISLHNWRLGPREFLGLGNYLRALTPGSEFWPSLGATLTYSLLAVPFQISIALTLAYLLFQKIRGKSLFRVVMFLPWVTSTVATAAVWARLYSPDIGLINSVLRGLELRPLRWLLEDKGVFTLIANGLGVTLPDWLRGPSLAMVAVVIYTTWVFVGYNMTLFLAGLGNIPGEMYEAAKIDGANGWQLFRHITWPLLSPTTFFVVLITVIGTLKAFNHIWVMTQGDNGTQTASILIYRQFYEFQRAGYASALAFLLSAVILLVTILQNRAAAERVNY